MIDPTVAALTVAAFLIGGFVKGAIGLGLPVVVLAMLALVMPLREAMAVFLIPGVASNIWQATNGPFLPVLLKRMWSFLLGAILGIVTGVFIMAGTKSNEMVVVLGVLLIAYSVFALIAPRLPEPGRREVWMSPAAGASAGMLFGMSGLFIVPGLLYLETLRMPRDQFVQALGLTFVTITGTLAISMTSFALVSWELALLSAFGLIPVFLGIWLGRRVRHRISETGFRKLFFVALIVSGIYMIARNWESVLEVWA
ncbi:MAG: sulfite exporter TauE/SafE family protein [Pseudomonadota bacterium]